MAKKALIIGAGLGGLSTALRLTTRGYEVEILEKHHQAGGRLNKLEKDGFTFDIGPSFFSMSYEFTELFNDCKMENPLQMEPLDPLYTVFFAKHKKPFHIYRDPDKLAAEFAEIEPNLSAKIEKYLQEAGAIFHDTEHRIVKRNFDNLIQYLGSLATVPLKHLPKLFRTMWQELEKHFDSEEVRVVFSLISFFLGGTPFQTPAVYSLLNYTEMRHDGYWNVKGGMYKIVESIVAELEKRKVKITYNTEIKEIIENGNQVAGFVDQNNNKHTADFYVVNSDAAAFRGSVIKRKKYSPEKLDKMDWSLAPFTVYLGVKGKIENLHHHNFFLGNNFEGYADTIFKTSVIPEKPYYYVNVASRSNPEMAPEGCENLFVLCPVPDRRYKPNWEEREKIAEDILKDLGERVGYDIIGNTITQEIYTPIEWEDKFNLYRGSGLGLNHGLDQVGALRPSNKDEKLKNLYYVGASTIPGTGLPIVVISSKLVTERIENEQ